MGELFHYGIPQRFDNDPRGSGRYRKGSGKTPQRNKDFIQRADELKKSGMTEKEIANAFGMSINQYRAARSISKNERQKEDLALAMRLKKKGYSNVAIGERLGHPESYVRTLLDPSKQQKIDSATQLAEVLKEQIEQHPYLDVGKGVNLQLGCSETQLKTAIAMLEEQGYSKHSFNVPQVSDPSHHTPMLVLTKDNVSYGEVIKNKEKISSPEGVYLEDYGDIVKKVRPPVSVDSNRIQIRYSEDGGSDKDGVIELRPGVEDISLGKSQYAQVRIAVDGTHYLKGMAMYSDDLPDGIDILFNTNKGKKTEKLDVLKPMKEDPTNPFGATVRQRDYIGEDGKEHQSAINIVNDDTDWDKWSRTLSSQFLSKQRPEIAKRQLDLYFKQQEQEFENIKELTNPTVKRKMLEDFADGCDSSAVHLKAAALPRQNTFAILPINSLKDTEVYAPGYSNGEEVVLVRYPHGGTFEIPKLKVNNNNNEGKRYLKNAEHAIGINSKVAQQLSGADFDGDTVVLIPTKGQKIKTSSPLRGLENFDPKKEYPAYEGMPKVGPKTKFHKQNEMGKVSNLITDMTIKGATDDEIARAVRHSMVVIDAEKHNLNWKQSYVDNGIAALKEKYQGGSNRGASTLISKAKSEERIPERKTYYKIDPETGEKIFRETGRTYKKNGKDILYTTVTTKMAETKDARKLSSGTVIEDIYASHANRLKALANKARKEILSTGALKESPSAKLTYKRERESLLSKLKLAQRNSPFERQAQVVAQKIVDLKVKENPDLDKDDLKKVRSRALDTARTRVGAKRNPIDITDREWEAIQSGAISDSKLSEILRYANPDAIKQRATPKTTKQLSAATLARARSWLNAGFTQAEVAEQLDISVSKLQNALKEG